MSGPVSFRLGLGRARARAHARAVFAVFAACALAPCSQPSFLRCSGFIDLGAGLAVGISGLAAGFAIGIVGDSGVRGTAQQPKVCRQRCHEGRLWPLCFAFLAALAANVAAHLLSPPPPHSSSSV